MAQRGNYPQKTGEDLKRKTDLPDNFILTDELRNWAKRRSFTRLEERMEFFIDYARSKGVQYADWSAAFRNSVRADWAKLNPKQYQSSVHNFSEDRIIEQGRALGIEARPGEEFVDLQRRIQAARH